MGLLQNVLRALTVLASSSRLRRTQFKSQPKRTVLATCPRHSWRTVPEKASETYPIHTMKIEAGPRSVSGDSGYQISLEDRGSFCVADSKTSGSSLVWMPVCSRIILRASSGMYSHNANSFGCASSAEMQAIPKVGGGWSLCNTSTERAEHDNIRYAG